MTGTERQPTGAEGAPDDVTQVGRVQVSKDPVHVRRRRLVAGGLAAVLLLGGCGANVILGGDEQDTGPGTSTGAAPDDASQEAQTGPGEAAAPGTAEDGDAAAATPDGEDTGANDDQATTDDEATADAIWAREPTPAEHPSDTTAMEQVDYLTGGMTPKSVMASGHGLAIANNMMYSHTSTVFDVQTREQVAVLDDGVELEEFGIEGHPGTSQGSPVEAVWTDDGRYAYVSQYTMYGENFGV